MKKLLKGLFVIIMVLSLNLSVYADKETKDSQEKSMDIVPWEQQKVDFKIVDERLKEGIGIEKKPKLQLHFDSIIHTPDKYIASGDLRVEHTDRAYNLKVICVSPDAINWEVSACGEMDLLYGIKEMIMDHGKFIGAGKYLTQSDNGLYWKTTSGEYSPTVRIKNPMDNNRVWCFPKKFEELKKVNGKYLAFGRSFYLFVSDDGKAWTKIKINDSPEYKAEYPYLNDVTWDGNQYVGIMVDIIEGGGGTMTDIVTSHDLRTWKKQNAITLKQQMIRGVHYENGKGTRYEKKGELKKIPLGQICPDLNSIIWDGSKYIAVGTNGRYFGDRGRGEIFISSDLVKWERPENFKAMDKDLEKIVYINGKYIVIGDNGTILISEDGKTFTGVQKYDFDRQEGSEYVYDKKLSTSKDCGEWHVIKKDVTNIKIEGNEKYVGPLNDIIWDGNKFIAVGNHKTVFFSRSED